MLKNSALAVVLFGVAMLASVGVLIAVRQTTEPLYRWLRERRFWKRVREQHSLAHQPGAGWPGGK